MIESRPLCGGRGHRSASAPRARRGLSRAGPTPRAARLLGRRGRRRRGGRDVRARVGVEGGGGGRVAAASVRPASGRGPRPGRRGVDRCSQTTPLRECVLRIEDRTPVRETIHTFESCPGARDDKNPRRSSRAQVRRTDSLGLCTRHAASDGTAGMGHGLGDAPAPRGPPAGRPGRAQTTSRRWAPFLSAGPTSNSCRDPFDLP